VNTEPNWDATRKFTCGSFKTNGLLEVLLKSQDLRCSWRYVVVVPLWLVASCQKDVHAPFEGSVSRSQYFEYHDRVQESLCPSLLSLLDQHAVRTADLAGLSLVPSSSPVRYYKFRDTADYKSSQGVPPESGGCAFPDALYSPWYFDAHEQTHVYVERAWNGPSLSLLDEGLAVALSCSPRPTGQDLINDWRDDLDPKPNSIANYTETGQFVAYLVGHYGWDKLGLLYRRVTRGTSAVDFEREFALTYPVSVDQAWSAAQQLPWACFTDWVCRSAPMNPGDDLTQDCDGEIHRNITVSDQVGAVISIRGPDVMLWKDCGAQSGPIYALGSNGTFEGTSWTQHWISLDPGTYTLTLMAPLNPGGGTPSQVQILLQSYISQPLLGNTCDTAGVVQLSPQDTSQIDLRSAYPINGWIRLAGGGGQSFSVSSSKLSVDELLGANGVPIKPQGQLMLCGGCDSSAPCVPLLPNNGSVLVPVVEGSVLYLEGVGAYGDESIGSPSPNISFQPPSTAATP